MQAPPAAEVVIDAALVGRLLRAQHPEFAELPLEPLESGWDNAIFRLGEAYCVRLPRRQVAATLIEHEQRWLSELAPNLPLPIPAPLRIGRPAESYPWNWSIVPWLPGTAADREEIHADQAIVLARFLKALHVAAPQQAPRNPVRGVPLAVRASLIEERLARLATRTDLIGPRLRKLWEAALAAPAVSHSTWLHGDLHAQNVLVQDGRLSAIIDWGDVCQGDCATDLAAIWMWLPNAASRAAAIEGYRADAATWQRARGWAIAFGAILLETGLNGNPRHAAIGARALRQVCEGP